MEELSAVLITTEAKLYPPSTDELQCQLDVTEYYTLFWMTETQQLHSSHSTHSSAATLRTRALSQRTCPINNIAGLKINITLWKTGKFKISWSVPTMRYFRFHLCLTTKQEISSIRCLLRRRRKKKKAIIQGHSKFCQVFQHGGRVVGF